MVTKAVIDTLIAEAGGEGEAGLIAAAWAIQQRAAARGQTIDEVIRSGFDGFTNPGAGAQKSQQDPALRAKVEQIMRGVQSGDIPNPVPGADHFLSGDVMPSWAKGMKHVATVGGHRFYASGNVPKASQGRAISANDLPAVASELSVNRAVQGMPTPRSPNPSNPPLPQPRPARTADVPLPRLDPRQPNRMDIAAGEPVVTERRLPPIVPNGVSYAGQERGPATAPRKPVVTPTPAQAEAATGFRLPGQSAPSGGSFAGQERGPVTVPRSSQAAPTAEQVRAATGLRVDVQPRQSTPALTRRQEERADNVQIAPRPSGPSSPPKSQDRLAPTAPAIVPRSGTVQPTRQQVEQGTGFRLPPAQVTPPGMPTPVSQRPASPLTEEVEVENPAYARLLERVKQGEIAMQGISANGQGRSRDALVQQQQALKDLEAARQQLAQTQRTIAVQQPVRQSVPVSVPRSSSTKERREAAATVTGVSTGRSYTVGQVYNNGNGSFRTNADGTFTNIKNNVTLLGSSKR
jgi:hypothetical protein